MHALGSLFILVEGSVTNGSNPNPHPPRMNRSTPFLTAIAMLATPGLHAQSDPFHQVQYWMGAGPDSTVLVIDFQDGSSDPGQSYAWGFLHNGNATAADMLAAIAAADVNLTVDVSGGFLQSITYNDHAGMGGAPNWWSTWNGTGPQDMELNGGLAEALTHRMWFGCSYTDFDPALPPTPPLPAYDPFRFTPADATFWVGSGPHTALLVVDLHNGPSTTAHAWGVRFNGSTTGEDMLQLVANEDPLLSIVLGGGVINEITYNGEAAPGGAPNWWSTWSATNLGNWRMNTGTATTVLPGELFGCSYTDLTPALRPRYPMPAAAPTAMDERDRGALVAFPLPATDVLHVAVEASAPMPLRILDLAGKVVLSTRTEGATTAVSVSGLAHGLYVLHVGDRQRIIAVQ